MPRSFHARHAWLLLLLPLLSLPWVIPGIRGTVTGANNNVSQWLPRDREETRTYLEFREMFGSGDFAVASWEGCTLGDERLERFAQAVVPEVVPQSDPQSEDDDSKWFEEVITGTRLVETLTDEPFGLSRDEAIWRLEGTLIEAQKQTEEQGSTAEREKDAEQRLTCAVIRVSEAGDRSRPAAVAALKRIAEKCGVAPEDLYLGGSVVANAAIDVESQRAIRHWIGLSTAIALAVAVICLRNLKLTAMIFAVAVYSATLATAAIDFTGGTMNLVLVMLPVLIYVLTLSACVHLCNYYRDEIRESGPDGAPLRAVRVGWEPCVLSAVTTALGLVSLYVSHIVPVRHFGAYSACGVLLGVGILFLLLPAMMEKFPLRGDPARNGAGSSPARAPRLHDLLRRLAGAVVGWRRTVLVVSVGLLAFFAGGVTRITTSVAPIRFLSTESRWVKDGLWLQENLGALASFETVVTFEEDCPLTLLERLETVAEAEYLIREEKDRVSGTISASTFGPSASLSAPSTADDGTSGLSRALQALVGISERDARRRLLNDVLTANRDHLIRTGYLHVADGKERWRISARVWSSGEVEHDVLQQVLQHRVDTYLAARLPAPHTPQTVFTGVVPLLYAAQRELLDGLLRSFCLAFVMIAVVMVLLLRSPTAGVLMMVPNVFPALVIFGAMGWTATAVDVGAMMTASVALGIAVDDTLHFLTWFRRGLGRGLSRRESIEDAFIRCAPAMTQTTLIAGLGLLVYVLSSFQPVSQFGLLMFVLLLAALVGDLVLLPAMLASPLGKVFRRKVATTDRAGDG